MGPKGGGCCCRVERNLGRKRERAPRRWRSQSQPRLANRGRKRSLAAAVSERRALAGACGGKGAADSELPEGCREARRREARQRARGAGAPPAGRGGLGMGKKWREAAEVERGCSDREDGADSRRCSRNTSRGRFAESWKRLSSKQGSTKRAGLPSQQTPVSARGAPGPPSLALRARGSSPFHGAELASSGAPPGNLWSRF